MALPHPPSHPATRSLPPPMAPPRRPVSRQLPLPLAPFAPSAPAPPSLPPATRRVRPQGVWGPLPAATRAQIRQIVRQVLEEVVRDERGGYDAERAAARG
jgi:hypothetical protein